MTDLPTIVKGPSTAAYYPDISKTNWTWHLVLLWIQWTFMIVISNEIADSV